MHAVQSEISTLQTLFLHLRKEVSDLGLGFFLRNQYRVSRRMSFREVFAELA